MDFAGILGWVTTLLNAWGLMPFIQAGVFIIVAVGVFVGIKNALQK